MSKFFYKVMKMISLAAALMFLVAAAFELMLQGMDLKVLGFAAGAVYCLIAGLMASTLSRDLQAFEPHYVRPADPPIMQYDGREFDYFGQDPTDPSVR